MEPKRKSEVLLCNHVMKNDEQTDDRFSQQNKSQVSDIRTKAKKKLKIAKIPE